MTYDSNRANKFVLGGHTFLLNIQSSKVGFAYPRLFIEVQPDEHLVLDLTLGAAFKMKEEDWSDWMSDCEEITTDEAKEALSGCINWDALEQLAMSA